MSLNPIDDVMLKGKRPVVSEEDNTWLRGFYLLKHGAVVRGEYSGEGVASMDILPGTNHSVEYSGTVGAEVYKLFFLHENALVANASHLVLTHAYLV